VINGFCRRSRIVTLQGVERVEVEVDLGVQRYRIHGAIHGFAPIATAIVSLRRPGGPNPEDVDPLDVRASFAAAKFQVCAGMVTAEGTYDISVAEKGYLGDAGLPGFPATWPVLRPRS